MKQITKEESIERKCQRLRITSLDQIKKEWRIPACELEQILNDITSNECEYQTVKFSKGSLELKSDHLEMDYPFNEAYLTYIANSSKWILQLYGKSSEPQKVNLQGISFNIVLPKDNNPEIKEENKVNVEMIGEDGLNLKLVLDPSIHWEGERKEGNTLHIPEKTKKFYSDPKLLAYNLGK